MLGIYTRISKDRPNQISTAIQKEQGIKLSEGLKIPYKLFEEAKGTSGGKSIAERPKLNELVNGIYDGTITAVYFYSQDRSSRDEITWFTLAQLILEYNVKLYENSVRVNLEDEDTYMLSGFKAIMSASFRRRTGRKIKDAHLKLIKAGKSTNPVITYGYKKDDNGFLILNDDEVKIVKRIYEYSLSGLGSQKIANILNEEGVPNRYSNAKGTLTTTNKISGVITTKDKSSVKWQQNTVLQILKRTWYYGKRTYKKVEYDVPGIFTKEYCDKVRDNLKNNRLNTGVIATDKYLLRGVLKCQCGGNMYAKVIPSKGENFYYCSSKRSSVNGNCGTPSINRPHLDKIIWEWFFKNDILTNLVSKHFEDTDSKEMIQELKQTLSKLNKQIDALDKEKTNTITFASRNIISPDELEVQLTRIRGNKNKIDNDILNTENQLQSYINSEKSSDEITKDISKYKNTITYNDQKQIIHKYIKDITLEFKHKHYVLTINWNLPQLTDYYLVVQKRCYYAVQPFSGDWQIVNKFQRVKKGKPVKQTNDEFFKSVYKEQQSVELFLIKNELLGEKFNLPNLNFESSPKADAELKRIQESPAFIELINKINKPTKAS